MNLNEGFIENDLELRLAKSDKISASEKKNKERKLGKYC